jgi:hypothetical protein
MDEKPVFIAGLDRCGKTTMQAFLASHPAIAIPAVGSNMWTYFYGQYGDLSQAKNLERCLDALFLYKHALFLQPDRERIRREFRQGEATYARLFALFHQHYAERLGKRRWGDQTGLIEQYADPIFAAFPEARMIHMIRDPRDRYAASLALWPDGKGRAGGAAARWRYSVGLAARNQKRYPDRYRIVHFETLVQQPEATLREICAFLGEAFTPVMLTMEGSPGHRAKLCGGSVYQDGPVPLSTKFIGNYREVLSKQEIAFIQLVAGRPMTTVGYTLEPVRLTAGEWLHFALLDVPLNLARLTAWRTLEAAHHAFPGKIGRRPARQKVVEKGGRTQTA